MVWGHGRIDKRLALLAALGVAGCIPGGMTPQSLEPEITEAGQPAAPPLAEPVAGSDAPVWESRSVAPNAADVIGTTYTVQPGDTLRGIGNRTGAGSEAIAAANGLTAPYILRPGQQLTIPGGRYHAASITCTDSLDVLRRAKERGLQVTASASINHLALNENDIGSYRTFLKLRPPLRGEADRAALAAAVAEGLVDVIMSDHDPQDVEVKRLPFAEAAFGAIGLETMLPVGLRLVHDGSLSLLAMLRAMSSRPAELLELPGGTLRPGSPADIVVFDPDVPWVLDRETLKSRCTNTAFDEARLTGRATRTIVAGRTVYEYV